MRATAPHRLSNTRIRTISQEFYKWLGCNFFMACFQGIADRKAWWLQQAISMYEGAPFRLCHIMSFNRFLEITASIRFTNQQTPTMEKEGYVDRFHEVRNMIDAFNCHYSESYHPSWLNCLDESMSSWLSKFCPGFMCVPCKPRPFGNKYHSIADGDDDKPIMWRVKIVEGKNQPKKANGSWAFPSEFVGYRKTATTMLEMTKPIHGKGKVVVGDSGSCVREGVIECHKLGVWFQAYVKKRGNWPRRVPGVAINMRFDDYELGRCKTLIAKHNNIPFMAHCCRDLKYVSKIMSTHDMLETVQDHPTFWKVDRRWKTFKHTEPFSRYLKVKHWVDNMNNRRHDTNGLEEGTKWWPMRQFLFLCSVAEVNAVQSWARGRNKITQPQLEFCRELARQMMENTLDAPPVPREPPVRRQHRLNNKHGFKKWEPFKGSWDPHCRKFKRVSTDYVWLKCTECGKGCRSYCLCCPGRPLCIGCFELHVNKV
jgi:hypothetical protein